MYQTSFKQKETCLNGNVFYFNTIHFVLFPEWDRVGFIDI